MAKKRWSELSPRTRRIILITGAFESLLKIAALIDLRRRPGSAIRGTKVRWASAIVLINSAGAVPIAYFLRGRRKQ